MIKCMPIQKSTVSSLNINRAFVLFTQLSRLSLRPLTLDTNQCRCFLSDHKIVSSQLSNYGIYGNAHQWVKSYLENRTQMCSINGSLYKSCSLSCGVPPGTQQMLVTCSNLQGGKIQLASSKLKELRCFTANYFSSKSERKEIAYNLRDSKNKLNVPLRRTNYYKNSFSNSGAILWNSLPSNLGE